MSFTYNLTSLIGQLRLEIRDNSLSDYTFEDEELQHFLNRANNDILWARVYAAENRCALAGSESGIEIQEGDARIKTTGEYGNNWCQLAKEWRYQQESGISPDGSALPFVYTGGIYLSDRESNEQDIRDGIIIERDFYDYDNEDTNRGNIVEN